LQDEQQRIEAAGGMVIFIGTWRVNGNLSVSRAIGDVKDKKYVIGEGDVSHTVMTGNEEYLVVACDGVWDVVDDQELVECIRNHLSKGNERHTTAKALVEFARSEGSGDNITAIIVFLNTSPAVAATPPSQPPSSTATETAAAPKEEQDEGKTNNEGGKSSKE
jgi:protein phosphatase 1E